MTLIDLDQYWPGRCVSAFSGSRSVLLSLLNAQEIQNRYGEKPREILPVGLFVSTYANYLEHHQRLKHGRQLTNGHTKGM